MHLLPRNLNYGIDRKLQVSIIRYNNGPIKCSEKCVSYQECSEVDIGALFFKDLHRDRPTPVCCLVYWHANFLANLELAFYDDHIAMSYESIKKHLLTRALIGIVLRTYDISSAVINVFDIIVGSG